MCSFMYELFAHEKWYMICIYSYIYCVICIHISINTYNHYALTYIHHMMYIYAYDIHIYDL